MHFLTVSLNYRLYSSVCPIFIIFHQIHHFPPFSLFHHFPLFTQLFTFHFFTNSHPSILSPILPIHLFSVYQSISLFALTRLFVSYQCYHCFRQYNDTQPSFCQLASLLCQLSLLCWSNNWYGRRSGGGGRREAGPITQLNRQPLTN